MEYRLLVSRIRRFPARQAIRRGGSPRARLRGGTGGPSSLGLEHQGQGFGTEARVGLLTLAFEHLEATAALTEVFQDNHASQRVSRKLGYQPDGISVDARGSEPVASDRLRLTRDNWTQRSHRPQVSVKGFPACREMLGL